MVIRLSFCLSIEWEQEGDFSVVCHSARDLLDALLGGADYVSRHIYKVMPQPGAPGTWPRGVCLMPVAWLPRHYDDDTLDLLCGAIFDRATKLEWGTNGEGFIFY